MIFLFGRDGGFRRAARTVCAGVLAASLGIGCGKATGPLGAGAGGTNGAGEEGGQSGTTDSGVGWPRRVTLLSQGVAQESKALRLADGSFAEDGDVALSIAVQLSLGPPMSNDVDIFCQQGTCATLADVPTDGQTCPGHNTGRWARRLMLSPSTAHTTEESSVIGLSTLVKGSSDARVYRLRIVGDSVKLDADGTLTSATATATLEYEPVP